MSTKLFIFCPIFIFIISILNFIMIHVHVTLIIALLAITESWTVKSSSDKAAFICLAEAHLQRVVCRISADAIFIPAGSMVGFSDFSPSFLSQPY